MSIPETARISSDDGTLEHTDVQVGDQLYPLEGLGRVRTMSSRLHDAQEATSEYFEGIELLVATHTRTEHEV